MAWYILWLGSGGYGKVIIFKHAGEIQTFYAYNDKNLVKKGQRVRPGEVIATL